MFFNSLLFAQTEERKYCGTSKIMEEALQDFEKKQILDQLEIFTQEFMTNIEQHRSAGPYIIPVVVHVVHEYEEENISYEQIDHGIFRINEDFNGLNEDLDEVIAEFDSIIGWPNIEFRLATKDPDGNCTYGVTRTASDLTTSGSSTKLQNLTSWDDKKYVNIWVVRSFEEGSGAAAFAYKPGSGPNMDGIFCLFNYFGDWGSSGPTGSNWARHTMPHEMGHFFNLDHPWGGSNSPAEDGNCSIDDGVEDTPETIGTDGNQVGCPLDQATCDGSLDNVQNIMDYSSCAHMFTQGQADRMLAAANSLAGNRWYLWQEDNLLATGTDDETFNSDPYVDCAPIPDFKVDIDLGLACTGESVSFENFTYNYRNTAVTYNWTFEGGIPASSNLDNPSVQYDNPGSYSVTLTACKGDECNTTIKENVVTILSQTVIDDNLLQDFENQSFPIMDSEVWWGGESHGEQHWERTNLVASQGSASMKIKSQSYGYDRKPHSFSTPQLDLSSFSNNGGSLDLCFDIAYARRLPYNAVSFNEQGGVDDIFSIHDDALIISYKQNCDANWVPRARISTRPELGGAEMIQDTLFSTSKVYFNSFVPNSGYYPEGEWKQICINVQQLAGMADAIIKFDFEGTGEDTDDLIWVDDGFSTSGELITASTIGGNWLYIDNILIGNNIQEASSVSRISDLENLSVSPNPSSNNAPWISFETLEDTDVTISVSNFLGLNIGRTSMSLVKGAHQFQLSDLFNLPAKGSFVVVVEGVDSRLAEIVIIR